LAHGTILLYIFGIFFFLFGTKYLFDQDIDILRIISFFIVVKLVQRFYYIWQGWSQHGGKGAPAPLPPCCLLEPSQVLPKKFWHNEEEEGKKRKKKRKRGSGSAPAPNKFDR